MMGNSMAMDASVRMGQFITSVDVTMNGGKKLANSNNNSNNNKNNNSKPRAMTSFTNRSSLPSQRDHNPTANNNQRYKNINRYW